MANVFDIKTFGAALQTKLPNARVIVERPQGLVKVLPTYINAAELKYNMKLLRDLERELAGVAKG